MRKIFSALALSFLAVTGSSALADDVYFENPVMAGDYPDPSVIRVGKDYWATATSSEWGPQFPLLHSRDLVNWEMVDTVFSKRPDWAVGNFWAPEIVEYKGKYFIYYVARKKGGPLAVAVASSDKPDGPYKDHGPMIAQDAGSIDPFPFNDEKGDRYLIWKEDGNSRKQPTIIWAQRLSDDGTKLVGEMKELIRNDAGWEGAVVEGPFMVKRGDWFYLFYSGSGCCGTGCNYAFGVARSKSLLGPWEKDPKNPLVAGNDDWKCPGHGSIVTDEQGRYWLLYHAYSAKSFVFTGREGVLDEIKFNDQGWPVINEGKGTSKRYKAPYNVAQEKLGNFADEFNAGKLRVGWQWPQDNEPVYKFDTKRGELTISPRASRANDVIGAVMARPAIVGDYVATAVVNASEMKAGTAAGLSAFGDSANAIGLMVKDGKYVLWKREKGNHQELAQIDAPNNKKIHLRFTAKEGHRFEFAASADGNQWVSIGSAVEGKYLPPWDRSIRVALTAGGAEGAVGRFDALRVVPAQLRVSQRN